MNYADWVTAVDSVLKNSGSGLRTTDLDRQEMQASFQRGESPVVFAKNARPKPYTPAKNTTKSVPSFFDMRTCGWILVGIGVVVALWYQFVFDTTTSSGLSGDDRIHNIGLLNDRLVGFMTGVGLLLAGLMIALLSPYGYSRECDFCKEPIRHDAIRCRSCGANLP